MNLEVRHLRLVQAIAEEGSMTRAAGQLHLTQSALSHQLRDIEQRLEAPLFLRLKKKMVLTPAGEHLLRSAQSVLADLERTEREIRDCASGATGVLRLSTECYTCYHWLPERFRRFQEKYPRVEVRIIADATLHAVPFLLDGKLDLAIVHDPVRSPHVVQRPLFRDELVAVMRPDHPLASRAYLRAEDFADQHLLSLTPNPKETVFFREVLNPAAITPQRISNVQLTEAAVELVKAGLGIAVLARWAVAPALADGSLVAVRVTPKGVYRNWSVAYLKNGPAPAYLEEFIRLLSDCPSPLRQFLASPNHRSGAARGLRPRRPRRSRR